MALNYDTVTDIDTHTKMLLFGPSGSGKSYTAAKAGGTSESPEGRVAILLQPFMPDSMAKLLDQLAVPADARSFAAFDAALRPGVALPAPAGVFPRYQDMAVG